jgi:hypothetical protein
MSIAECKANKPKRLRSLPIAERQKISPPALARLWGVEPSKILGWIERGELAAINGASSTAGRPRYLIDRRDIEAFEQSRRVSTPAPRSPRRKRSAPGAKEYF